MPRTPLAKPDDVFCGLLRETRTTRGVTQSDLAAQLGFEQSHISKVERGARQLGVLELRAWVSALGVTLPIFATELEARLSNLEVLQRRGRSR